MRRTLRHIRTLVWLRFRLLRNQSLRHRIGKTAGFLGVLAFLGSSSFVLAWQIRRLFQNTDQFRELFVLNLERDLLFPAVLLVVSLLWQMLPLFNMQHEEFSDPRRLIVFPIPLSQVFFLNLAANVFDVSTLFFFPALFVLFREGQRLYESSLVLGLALLAFVFLNALLSRTLIGLLIRLVKNPRFLLAAFATAFLLYPIAMAGLASVDANRDLLMRFYEWSPLTKESLLTGFRALPMTWPGLLLAALYAEEHLLALLYACNMLLCFALLSSIGVRQTLSDYYGLTRQQKLGTAAETSTALLMRCSDALGLRRDMTAIAFKEFLLLSRNWRILLAFVLPVLLVFVIAAMYHLVETDSWRGRSFMVEWLPLVLGFYVSLGIIPMQANTFGQEGRALANYDFLPVSPADILSGKILAAFLFALLSFGMTMTLFSLFMLEPLLNFILPAYGMFLSTFFGASGVATVLSVLFPQRVEADRSGAAVPFISALVCLLTLGGLFVTGVVGYVVMGVLLGRIGSGIFLALLALISFHLLVICVSMAESLWHERKDEIQALVS